MCYSEEEMPRVAKDKVEKDIIENVKLIILNLKILYLGYSPKPSQQRLLDTVLKIYLILIIF